MLGRIWPAQPLCCGKMQNAWKEEGRKAINDALGSGATSSQGRKLDHRMRPGIRRWQRGKTPPPGLGAGGQLAGEERERGARERWEGR